MTVGKQTKVIASVFALSAFAVAIVAGMAAGVPASTVIVRAIVAMVICQILGWGIGFIMARVIREQVEAYREANPIPEMPSDEELLKEFELGDVEIVEDEEFVTQSEVSPDTQPAAAPPEPEIPAAPEKVAA